MGHIHYEFNRIQNAEKTNYIFQLVKNRTLSRIYHSHDFYEIVYFLQGESKQIINETPYFCTANLMILLRPNDRHRFIIQSDNTVLFSLSVRREEFESFCSIYGKDLLNRILNAENPLLCENCSLLNYSLLDYENMAANLKEYDCKFLLSSVLHYCIQHSESNSVMPSSLSFAINEIKKTENLHDGIEAMIRLSNYSQTHLARMMKKYYNTTPKQYINELRLQNAYNCIILTQKSVESIAEELGFKSYSHFTKIFKERFSVTPASLRKQREIWTV